MSEGYVRPEFGTGEGCSLIIKGGRHPVIEAMQQVNHATFVPGDVYFGASSNFGLWRFSKVGDRVARCLAVQLFS